MPILLCDCNTPVNMHWIIIIQDILYEGIQFPFRGCADGGKGICEQRSNFGQSYYPNEKHEYHDRKAFLAPLATNGHPMQIGGKSDVPSGIMQQKG